MSETVVHVTTLEQWDSVLDVWFKKGYSWFSGLQDYNHDTFNDEYFRGGASRYLLLDKDNDILTPSFLSRNIIEYSEFMAQQKEDKEVKTYYVTQEQLDLIEKLREDGLPFFNLVNCTNEKMKNLDQEIQDELDKPVLRYIGGDETIEFKVKEPLYRLWRKDGIGDRVYMHFTSDGNPDWTMTKDVAFSAPLEEIKKWKTPAWDIEKAD